MQEDPTQITPDQASVKHFRNKYHYRFVFLTSDKWKDVRIEALARDDAKCNICGERALSNDAHHYWYPESVWNTVAEDLIILCRPCHTMVHTVLWTGNRRDRGLVELVKLTKALGRWIDAKGDFYKETVNPYALPKKHYVLPRGRPCCCRACRVIGSLVRHREFSDIMTNMSPKLKAWVCDECWNEYKTSYAERGQNNPLNAWRFMEMVELNIRNRKYPVDKTSV